MHGPLKWYGGKHYLAGEIVNLLPPHTHYVEPYAGGLAVLFAKSGVGVSEVVNDINHDIMNFWRVLRHEDMFSAFKRQLEAVPVSRQMWDWAHHTQQESKVSSAVAFFTRIRQSFGGQGTSFTPASKSRTRRGMNEQVSAWLGAIEGLPAVHARLRRVFVECLPALDVIHREDSVHTCFYCDPPYLHETRQGSHMYEYEMSNADHEAMLVALCATKGRVVLSGYDSDLYTTHLRSWKRYTFDLPNNASGAGGNRRRMQEVVWVK